MSLTTRSQTNKGVALVANDEGTNRATTSKRNAEDSPEKILAKKRSVLNDLTNAISKKNKNQIGIKLNDRKATKRNSQTEIETDGSETSAPSSQEMNLVMLLPVKEEVEANSNESPDSGFENMEPVYNLPDGVFDFDKSCIGNPHAEPNYAMEIFNYYKEREERFKLKKYMDNQPELTKSMRSILTDWLVEVQESFELNHETLYLAVKIIDHYLMNNKVPKPQLQLLGATAVFIACKFDERSPPLVDDFLYICDDAYSRKEMLDLEQKILKSLNFDLGIPLSYRFLRRYARCAKVSMEILTLARYVLETSLMDYDLIVVRDSKLAAACLYLALKMKNASEWTPTLQYYSGYDESDIENLVKYLNNMISQPSQKNLLTIKSKYSHKVFFEVAKIPPLPPVLSGPLD